MVAKGTCIALVAVTATLCGAQPVSFAFEAAPAAKVIPALGKVLGGNYKVTGDIAKETLLIQVHAVDRAALLQRIAKVLHSTWQEKDGEHILSRSPSQEAALAAEELDLRAKAYEVQFAKRIKPVLERPFTQEVAHELALQRARRLSKDAPSASFLATMEPKRRLALRILSLFSPRQLVKLFSPRTFLFSTKPTGPMLALPDGANEALDKFRGEETLLERELTQQGVPFTACPGVSVTARLTFERDGHASVNTETEGDYALTLSWAALRPVFSSNDSLSLEFEKLSTTKLSPLAAALVDPWGQYRRWSEPLQRTAKHWMEHPEDHDPLASYVGESLADAARQLHLQLVAVVPDACAHYRPSGIGERFKLSEFLKRCRECCTFERSDGWLDVEPLFPITTLRAKDNRRALGELFRSYFSKGRNTIQAESAYVHSFADPFCDGLESVYTSRFGWPFTPNDGRGFCSFGEPQFLYF